MAEDRRGAIVECTTINDVIVRNHAVEMELQRVIERKNLEDATADHFLNLTALQLQDFIHARKFDGMTFQKIKACGIQGKAEQDEI